MSNSNLFHKLCMLSAETNDYNEAQILEKAIFETKQGKECLEILKQYNDGLMTFVEFRNTFVQTALK